MWGQPPSAVLGPKGRFSRRSLTSDCIRGRAVAFSAALPFSGNSSQKFCDSASQFPISKLKPTLFQLLRQHPRTRQYPFFREFSERQLRRKRGHRKNRWPPHNRRQHPGKLRISHRIRRDNVHCSRKIVGRRASPPGWQTVKHRRDCIINVNPTPPLPSAADFPAQAKTKWAQHLLERAALFAQHDAKPQIHHPNSRDPHVCRRFPLPTDFRQKPFARRTVFRQNFIPAISVISNRRSAHKCSRRYFSLRNRPRQIPRANHPAIANFSLLLRRPPSRNVLSREMDHNIEARHQLRRNFAHWLPLHLVFCPN